MYKQTKEQVGKSVHDKTPLDSNTLVRWFHLHCLIHIYRILFAKKSVKNEFVYPRFELFKKLNYRSALNKQDKYTLFLCILWNFKKDLLIGALITIIYSCLNLLIPLLIKSFMHFMHDRDVNLNEIKEAEILIITFVLLQLLRIIFGEHSKRLFFEIAIKVESSLAILMVKKSLTISPEIRQKIPQSEVLHLQNVDMKLVFTMVQNMYLLVQAPFTILIALLMIYLQNYKYGLIAIYWFVVAFLIQRQLDSKMRHCNDTKLDLIEQRSKINYEILGKIREAKLSGHQEYLIEKNNDYFIEENHDHKMFYEYVTLYDISLIMLPILVIVTIALYDLAEPNHITVQQVYVILSLLGICYNPMKSFRTLAINFHDGLWSLEKIEQYLNQKDQQRYNRLSRKYQDYLRRDTNIKDKRDLTESNASLRKLRTKLSINKQPLIIIENKSKGKSSNQISDFQLEFTMKKDLELYAGERLVVVGKVESGIELFHKLLTGMQKLTKGRITINDKISYLGQQNFFINNTVRENIRFYNKDIPNEQIQTVFNQLNLDNDLKLTQGLDGTMDDQYRYSKAQLHKIALARLLCSEGDIFLLDQVFKPLNSDDQRLVNEILRQKQDEGKLVILTNTTENYFKAQDLLIIVEKEKTIEIDRFSAMITNDRSSIHKFVESGNKIAESPFRKNADIIKRASETCLIDLLGIMLRQQLTQEEKQKVLMNFISPALIYGVHLAKILAKKNHDRLAEFTTFHYIKQFLKAVKPAEFIYIFLIIAMAEMMHIFIHFYFGHLQQAHGDNSYLKFQNMIIVEVILTTGLCLIIYLEGEVSSYIAIIQGNQLYNSALQSLTDKKISWYSKEYSVKIANRLNHDYEEVFIALHMLLNIYKNLVILVFTLLFLSDSAKSLILMVFSITIAYMTVYSILRTVETKVVDFYEEFKYHYVKVLEESVGGAQLINLYGASGEVINSAKEAYKKTAAYKIAESYTSYGEQILCDLVSLIIFSVVLDYGLQSKIEGNSKSIALIATMIHLLIGVFDVLKSIVKDTVNFETFFRINLLPFVEIIKQKPKEKEIIDDQVEASFIQQKSQMSLRNTSRNALEQSRKTFKTGDLNIFNCMVESVGMKKVNSKYEIVDVSPQKKSRDGNRRPTIEMSLPSFQPTHEYEVEFRDVILHESKYHETVFNVFPLNLLIKPGQRVLMYESDDNLKNYLVYALTKNLPMFFNPQVVCKQRTKRQRDNKEKTILIGGRDICHFPKEQLEQIVQVIIDHDFYIKGTLQDNIKWKNKSYEPEQATLLAKQLNFHYHLPGFEKYGIKSKIQDPDSDLMKKMTLLRILTLKPKIIVTKDTETIVGKVKIVQVLDKYLPGVTVVKIDSNISSAFDVQRVVLSRHLDVLEDRKIKDAISDPFSQIGNLLRQANLKGHVYANEMSETLAEIKYVRHMKSV